MEIYLSSLSLFAMGTFIGALFGRLITFGVLAVSLICMLVIKS
jgi:uncharacterized membrane protein YccC